MLTLILRRIEPDPVVLGKRTLTALALALATSASIFAAPGWAPVLLIGLLVLAGAWEWSGLIGVRPPPPVARAAYVALVGTLMLLTWQLTADAGSRMTLWLLAALWWGIAFVWLLWRGLTRPPAAAAAGVAGAAASSPALHRIPAAIVAFAGLLSLVPAWVALARVHLLTPSPWPLVIIIALVVAADVGAYFTGRLLGRHRLAPAISPGKTWEGLGGGLAAALLVALGVRLLGLPAPDGILPAALALALVSVVGDLTVSLFKRDAGVKHSGTLLPGHGGVLDRIDSFCSAAPAYALWMTLVTPWL